MNFITGGGRSVSGNNRESRERVREPSSSRVVEQRNNWEKSLRNRKEDEDEDMSINESYNPYFDNSDYHPSESSDPSESSESESSESECLFDDDIVEIEDDEDEEEDERIPRMKFTVHDLEMLRNYYLTYVDPTERCTLCMESSYLTREHLKSMKHYKAVGLHVDARANGQTWLRN